MFARLIQASLLIFTLGFAFMAAADEAAETSNGSEFLYQSPAGKFDISPAMILGFGSIKYNDTNSGYTNLRGDVVSIPIGVGAEYGITNMLSVGLGLSYSSAKTTYTCDFPSICPKNKSVTGLDNPTLDIKARFPVGTGSIRVGATASLSLSKSKIDSSGDANADTGGTTVTPYAGYELPLGPGYLGGRVSYDLYKGDRKQTDDRDSSETTFKGGAVLAVTAFYEANVGIMTYGGAVTYSSQAQSKYTIAGGSDTDNKDALTAASVEFYTPVHFNPTITLLPVASFTEITYTSSGAPRDSAGTFYIGAAGRFTF